MTLLAVSDLTVSLGGRVILDRLSFTVGAGESLGLVGDSGSGKSMTSLALIGLLPDGARASGEVRFAGHNLLAAGESVLGRLRGRDLAMVFQEPASALNPVQSIVAQVAETVRIHARCPRAQALARARAALVEVGLDPARVAPERFPHELSGGQRQRVAIAMAMVLAPRLLICDEPTTALDVSTQAQVLGLLRALVRAHGTSLVFVSHDLATVAEVADRIVVLEAGRIAEQGATVAVLRRQLAGLRAAERVQAARPAPTPSGAPVLEVRDLVREYPGPGALPWVRRRPVRALGGISFSVAAGERVAVVGESGSGKSTLLRAVLGLEPAQAGQILVRGRRIEGLRGPGLREMRRSLALVFQDPATSFNRRHRVAHILAEPLRLLEQRPTRAEVAARVAHMLARVGLACGDAARLPHEFSGGQRQRLAIARALMLEPRLIALDEALSALDWRLRAQILDLLAGIGAERELGYLFVSHDLATVRDHTDRVLVLRDGVIVEEGPTARIFTAPRHPYTAELVAASPDLERVLERRSRTEGAS